jgi:predicted O-methyltransferase YrrM
MLPAAVIETEVFRGVSSAFILAGLQTNNFSDLYSIDIAVEARQVGWVISDNLKTRWHLLSGKSAAKLPDLLTELETIDIFFHDRDHSYKNMIWEFEKAWQHLCSGGILLSHNIDFNNALRDFCKNVNLEGHVLDDLGGLVKP